MSMASSSNTFMPSADIQNTDESWAIDTSKLSFAFVMGKSEDLDKIYISVTMQGVPLIATRSTDFQFMLNRPMCDYNLKRISDPQEMERMMKKYARYDADYTYGIATVIRGLDAMDSDKKRACQDLIDHEIEALEMKMQALKKQRLEIDSDNDL